MREDRLNEKKWCALQAHTLKEKRVAALLEQRGYEQFLPLWKPWDAKNARSGQSVALFPGYLFCRFDINDRRVPVLTTPGVIKIVSYGPGAAQIRDEEIEALRRVMSLTDRIEPTTCLREGQKVRLIEGPFRGIEGKLCWIKNDQRLIVEITLIQRAVSVEVDMRWVVPVEELEPRSCAHLSQPVSQVCV
jgi:transcription antitermination factor NusG